MNRKKLYQISLALLLFGSSVAHADWPLPASDIQGLQGPYDKAVKQAEHAQPDQVSQVKVLHPLSQDLRWSDDFTKILMVSVVPKWCIDKEIYVPGKDYRAADWNLRVFVDEHNSLVRESTADVKMQHRYRLVKGQGWTGGWVHRLDASGRKDELRPVLDMAWLEAHHGADYAAKIQKLVDGTGQVLEEQSGRGGIASVYVTEEIPNTFYRLREILRRDFDPTETVSVDLLKASDRKLLTDQRLIWLSPVPQVREYLQAFHDEQTRNLKIREFTGLPPINGDNNIPEQYAVEMWVDPHDLIRTCPNAQTLESTCISSAPYTHDVPDAYKDVFSFMPRTRDLTYEMWFKANTASTYSGKYKFPWTRLGYTYNWDPEAQSNVGVSEFVLRPGATAHVDAVHSLKDYP